MWHSTCLFVYRSVLVGYFVTFLCPNVSAPIFSTAEAIDPSTLWDVIIRYLLLNVSLGSILHDGNSNTNVVMHLIPTIRYLLDVFL